MIPIYICEDNSPMLQQIKQQILNCCMIEDLDFKIVLATENPETLLDNLQKQRQQGIYFLDVDLNNEAINGFQLGKKIRQLDPRGFLVYVTTHNELLSETFSYRLEALDYILKDNPAQVSKQIREALLTIQELLLIEQTEKAEIFTIENASNVFHLPVSAIQYFETTSKKHTVALITDNEYLEFYGSLAKLAERFSEAFIRTHQSYLVNKAYIQRIDKKARTVVLKNGNTCLVARTKMKELKQLDFNLF